MKYEPLLHSQTLRASTPQKGAQTFNQKGPDSINCKQIDCKENNRNQSDDCGVLYHIGCRPRNAPHLCADVTQELLDSRKETCARAGARRAAPAAIAGSKGRSTLDSWWRCSTGCFGRSNARR